MHFGFRICVNTQSDYEEDIEAINPMDDSNGEDATLEDDVLY